jgi:putative addiction module CopG family antidote
MAWLGAIEGSWYAEHQREVPVMTAHLPEDLERFIHDQVRAGHYRTEEEVIRDALERLRRHIRTAGHIQDPPGSGGDAAARPDPIGERAKDDRHELTARGPLTDEEFQRHLLGIGLMSRLPDRDADVDDPDDQPIDIVGEPLSETVIRERR